MQESQYAMIALFILFTFSSNVPVQAQTPCSISNVNFYPQTAYAGQLVSIISQVIFTCGPSYNNVWQVRVDLSNSTSNIASTNSVQHVYAGYTDTAINVTDTFTAPQKEGLLSLNVHAYIVAQSSNKIFASWSSILEIQVQPVLVAYTTTTSTPVSATTAQYATTTQPTTTVSLTTSSTTQSGFSLSTDQVYMLLAIVFSVLLIVAVMVRLKQRLRKNTRDDFGSLGTGKDSIESW